MSTASSPAAPETLTLPEALARAHAFWNAGQAVQAEQLCQRVLALWPGQADALHLLGLMAHAYGNLDLAISYLSEACKAPRALADGEAAARRAVTMDPALAGAWNNLGIVLQEAGKFEESLACLERVVALQPDGAQAHNNLGNTLRRLGHMDRAEVRYREALKLDPAYAEAHSNLAFLLSTQGSFDAAATEARLAIELSPRLIDAYLNLTDVEMSRHRYEAALQVLDALAAFAPQHPSALVARSKALRQVERFDEALACARQAVASAPQNADAHNTLAGALQSLGHTEAALAEFEKAAQLPGVVTEEALVGLATLQMEAGRKEEALAAFERAQCVFPDSVIVLASRADIHTFKADAPGIAVLEACVAQGTQRALTDRIAAHFALGKAYLDIKNPQQAFHHFGEGNRHKRSTFSYDSAATEAWMKRIADSFAPELYPRLKGSGERSELPVFILGMPRSGTTLLEQIVSSHPQVTGAGELAALRLVVEGSGGFPDNLPTLASDGYAKLGREYLARVTPLAQGRARLVDKMPGNFFYAGLIPLILPGARIIHARRDPVDTCLSCYTKQFGGAQQFTYDQTELGEYYRFYDRLMAHWRQVLPSACFIEVDYEAVVDDLEHEARRLIEFVGLPWDDACLSFHDNRRVVRTASLNQVRQPIYKTSKGRWQAHAQYLGPLLTALGVQLP
jgi:tetratricopeptide (TPR) repeat protein